MSLTYKGGRLAVLVCSLAATVFFLIFAQLQIRGGANAFTEWADLIAFGGKADPGLSQRDVGYPLLLVLSGYPYTQSFVGITVINAVLATLLPLTVYATVGRAHPALALVTALAVILSSTPYAFMKFIHHDHAHLSFQMLCVYFGVSFLRRRESWRVYAMTAAGLAASLCRPSGNLLLVFVFIFVLVVETRRAWKHILACAVFAVLVLGSYADYRNRIGLDQPQDSYVGRQLFYNPYVNSRAFGIRLGPDTGPAMSRLIDALREGLREKPPGSKEFDDWLVSQGIPREAAAVYFDGRSADEIVNRVLTHPHYDFFELLCFYEPDDRVFRAAAIEIMTQHPFAVLGYTLRNMVLFVASDGYAHGRYGLNEDAGIRRGGTYSPWFRWLTNDLWPVKALYWLWRIFVFALIALSGVLAALGLIGPWTLARRDWIACWFSGLVLGYNAAIVSAFVDPQSRYQFASFPEQLICAAFGACILLMIWRQREAWAKRLFRPGYK